MEAPEPTITVSKNNAKTPKDEGTKKEFFGLLEMPEELAERARDIWLAGLGALSMVEEEGTKLFNTLVEKGEAWEKEGRKQLGAAKEKLDEAREKVETAVGDAAAKTGKITDLDDVIFAAVEDTVEKVLQRLGVPTHAEVKDLAGKVEKLSKEVVALAMVIERGKEAGAPAGNGEAAAETAKKIVYHVVPHGEEGWAIKQEHIADPLGVYPTKDEALTAGRAIAKDHMPSRLVTHKKDGKVQESTTYEG